MVRYSFDKKTESGNLPKHQDKGFWTMKFIEFCKRTDLHGYKYIVMKDLSAVERFFWTLTIIISIAVAAYFVVTAYRWYARNPIVTVIESTQGVIWDVPFPAVTICDLNMVSRRAAINLSKSLSLPGNITTESLLGSLRLTPLIHTPYTATKEQKEQLQMLQLVLDYNNMSLENMFRAISPVESCNHLIQKCLWKNTMYPCNELFEPVFTVLNLCCTFNYFAEKRTKKVDKSGGNQYLLSTPRRVASCGYQTALTVIINIDPADYFSASVASQGAMLITNQQVFIDSAYNIPNRDSPVRMINPSTEVLIALTPERTYTTSGIKSFEPDMRQCYYSDEVAIEGIEKYSFHNCMAAMKVEIMKKICNCTPFYFPNTDSHRTCNFYDMNCLDKALLSENGKKHNPHGQCLPECEHYDNLIEVAMGKLSKKVDTKGLAFFKSITFENRSILNVFFNDLVSTRYRRDVYLNWQNILAAFGGLLSLMLGFTLISGFDLLLFLTVRVAYQSFLEHFPAKWSTKQHSQKIHFNGYQKKPGWISQ